VHRTAGVDAVDLDTVGITVSDRHPGALSDRPACVTVHCRNDNAVCPVCTSIRSAEKLTGHCCHAAISCACAQRLSNRAAVTRRNEGNAIRSGHIMFLRAFCSMRKRAWPLSALCARPDPPATDRAEGASGMRPSTGRCFASGGFEVDADIAGDEAIAASDWNCTGGDADMLGFHIIAALIGGEIAGPSLIRMRAKVVHHDSRIARTFSEPLIRA